MDGLVQNIVCLDSSNCNQENAFFNSLWKIAPPCFCFPLYRFQRAFCSVLNCTCSLLFCSIFHFLFTTYAWQPFSAKTILGSLHLICIINRLHKRATSKRKQNKHRNEQDGWGTIIYYTKVVSRSPHPTRLVTLPPGKWKCFALFNIL